MTTILRTPRLVLRRMRLDDVPALHAILSDPVAMRFWSHLPFTDPAASRDWVQRTIDAIASGEADDFAVTRDGAVIGKAGIWRGNELGFFIAPAHWGHGYGREAVGAVIAHGFASGLAELFADVDPRNEACLRLLAALGFAQTGRAERTYCIGGEWADSVYFALRAA